MQNCTCIVEAAVFRGSFGIGNVATDHLHVPLKPQTSTYPNHVVIQEPWPRAS